MERITSKSKRRVFELLQPGPGYKQPGPPYQRVPAPRNLTVRRLQTKRYKKRVSRFSFAVIDGGHLVCLANLTKLGFDLIG